MKEAKAVLLSDVHLGMGDRRPTEHAVSALLEQHAGSEVVFVGDLFEFASASAADATCALKQLLDANPVFCAALRSHVAGSGKVTLISGNHDAALAAVEPDLQAVFGFPVKLSPWFERFGSVHVEHGHLFDRDNAPLHPLASYFRGDDPLGVVLMREFVVRLGAQEFAHAHQTTPAQALARAARLFRWRLPQALLQTGVSFSGMCLGAAWGRWGRAAAARAEGELRLGEYARRTGVSELALLAICERAPAPTHARFRTVFARLYLDWVLACWIGALGGAAWAVSGNRAGLAPAAAALYVVGRGLRRVDSRYASPVNALRTGARLVAHLTGASRVVFGHTHVEEEDEIYFNLGSFGYPGRAGRPYALITVDGELVRRHLRA